MKPEELQKFRELLLKEKRRIWKSLMRIKKVEQKIGDSWQEPKDLEDWAQVSFDEFFKLQVANHELQIVREIDEALKRIEQGKYGLCERCGNLIERERLKLLPWTRLCSKCARLIGG
ncbi:MAG: TraR/DksA family transcriptional regulator [Candidatus Hydrothermota bacterium]|nr:MAG: TraR/DksA family transcriptional regulator [Candidatus Hydrothermae bacterium]